jgi:glyoxylase-like metal-dependent hydrolase (beta-lactamase superfamily II)
MPPKIHAFFDEQTFAVTYLVIDYLCRLGVVIDPVLNFDPRVARTSTRSADMLLAISREAEIAIPWILETHIHADHLTAATYLKERTGAKIAVGEHVCEVQKTFAPIFETGDIKGDGTPFERLLKDGETLQVGGLVIEVIATPGHTPACVSYRIGGNVFVGDTLFMPDVGTARADFPGGDARILYRSIQRILSLSPDTVLWICHDYKAPGRDTYQWRTTVGEQRAKNIHVHDGVTEDAFTRMRMTRDKTLAMPTLMLPSVQVNIRAGQLPAEDSEGHIYLRIPVNRI